MALLLSVAFVPPSLSVSTLVDDLGIPRYWALSWTVIDGAGIAPSYLRRQLAAIELLYRAAEMRTGSDCLDQILAIADLKALRPVLEGLFIELTNRSVSMGFASNDNWTFIFRFVQRVLERGAESKSGQLHRIQAKLDHLTKLYGQLNPMRPFAQGNLRALPAAVVQDLYELVDPFSTRNPFRSEDNCYRNYALVLLLLHLGLRRSEVCGLLADSIKSAPDYRTGDVRSWINIARRPKGVIDTRSSPAELKTPQSKRQLPIGSELVAVIDHYTENYRGKAEHPFLFSSQKGLPLSLPMVNSIFETLSEHLSDAAKRELRDRRDKTGISPHDLRHTAAVFRLAEFLEAGETMEVALGKLRAFFGWSKRSNMPSHYAGAYFEHRLAMVWNGHFDVHVERLRQLEN
jgi:integrase